MAEQVAIKGIQLLHKRYATSEWANHTLQAGELGLDLTTFEVRIGTAANQAWANAAPVGIKSITKNTEGGSDYLKDVSFDIKTGTMTLIYAAFTFADDEAVKNLKSDIDALELTLNGDAENDGLVTKFNALDSDYTTHKQDFSNAMDLLSGNIEGVDGKVATINGSDTGSSMRQVAESVRDAYNTATVAPLAERVSAVEGAVATKVEAEAYNTKVQELQGAINAKVATETYNAKVEELEGAIDAKVAQSAYDTKVAELQGAIDAKVAQSAYDTKVKALDDEDDRLEGLINTEKDRIDGIVADYETATHAAQTYETIAEANKVRGRVEVLEKAGYLTAADKTELQNNIDGVSGKVTTLIGEDANKSVRTIANEELAKQLVAEGAAESLDTLAEIAAWIQSHPEDAAAMNKAIDDLEALVGTLPADITATTVTGYVTEVKNAVQAEIARLDAEKQDVITEKVGGTGTYTLEDWNNEKNIETASLDDITSIAISGTARIVFGDMDDPESDYEEDRNFSVTLDDFNKYGDNLYLDFPLSDYPNAISTTAEIYLEEKDGVVVLNVSEASLSNLTISYNGGGMVVKKEHLPADLAYKNEVEAVSNSLTNNYYTKQEVNNALNEKATVSSVNTVAEDLDKVEAKLVNIEETVVKSIEAAVEVEKGRAEGAEGQLANRIKAIEDKGLENGSVYAKQADLEATDAIADAAKEQAETNKAAIETLNGTGENSVSGKITAAINGLNIDQYATDGDLQDVSGVANAADTLSKENKAAIDVLNGTTADSVSGKINAAIAGLNISQYATTGALAEVSNVANAADVLSKANAGKIATLEAVTYEGDGKVTLTKEGNVVKAAHAATFAEAQTEGFYTFSFDKYGHITGVKAITVLDGNA